jgi:translation initiation factor eIF-2B subunit gamma
MGADSLIGEGSKVGEKCSIKKSVIGSHCVIGKNVKLNNCVIMDHVMIEDKYGHVWTNFLVSNWIIV